MNDKKYEILWRAPVGPDVTCVCCPRHFPTGRALTVRDWANQLFSIGPTCASRFAFKTHRHIPDLTATLLPVVGDEHDDKKSESSIVFKGPVNGQQLSRDQLHVIDAAILRVVALPSVGIHIDPVPRPLTDLVEKWQRSEAVSDQLWTQAGRIIAGCDRMVGKDRSLATSDLMTAMAVQIWLNAALRTARLRPDRAQTVQRMRDEQKVQRRLTLRQFDYLAKLTDGSGVEPPQIDPKWFRQKPSAPPVSPQ